MSFLQISAVLIALSGFGVGEISNIIPTVATTTARSTGKIVDPFLPHATYLSANSYVDNVPYGVAYNAKPLPALGYQGYFTKMMPSAQTTLEVVLWLVSKIGTVLFGSAVLFLVGGGFNAFICAFTSLCTYDFRGLGVLNNESVRSFITPEKISTAAALVQDAIGKYNRLQREVPN